MSHVLSGLSTPAPQPRRRGGPPNAVSLLLVALFSSSNLRGAADQHDIATVFASTEDFAFNFDQPAFYLLLGALRTPASQPAVDEARTRFIDPADDARARPVADWQALLERPREYRGRYIRVNGRIGRNKDPFLLRDAPEAGPLTQLELERDDQPTALTVVCLQDVSDLPVGAEVEFAGYFVMVRSYYGANRRALAAPLIVARGPLAVSQAGPVIARTPPLLWYGVGGAFAAAVVIFWWILRRAARAAPAERLRAALPERSPEQVAADLARLESAPDAGTEA